MNATGFEGSAQTLRPSTSTGSSLEGVQQWIQEAGYTASILRPTNVPVTGITMDSREVQPGDLYVALPGARAHGAQFLDAVVAAGASAILTDTAGVDIAGAATELPGLVQCEDLRAVVGPLAAEIYRSQPSDGSAPTLFAVTGTNGKTTSTYMINAIMQSLGNATGLIGTIEILAGGVSIPSKLTTPESPHVHSLLSLMRENGIGSAAMEVSSHALDYRRVDGVRYDVAGFTNLTQDHLDLHGTMDSYFESKAALFTPERARRAVILVDDEWGEAMAAHADQAMGVSNVVRLRSGFGAGVTPRPDLKPQDWAVTGIQRSGIGHEFTLVRGDGFELRTSTQLPADFNVSNAALAAVMVAEGTEDADALAQVLAQPETLTPVVPGRMQLIAHQPTALVDFAHNPDALKRALEAVEPAENAGRIIVVFGATGERDQTKRPIMGAIAAQYADIVIVTDDDPHGEDPEPIRVAVETGAREAVESGARAADVLNIAPRTAAIEYAAKIAGENDSIVVAGRGHETAQDVAGVDLDLDDRVEVARALTAYGYDVLPAYRLAEGA
ncbi:UDP-N-acetylmuramoyl-L-alanyl-D-glutamate--2,6-diaminopimelate ligase [Rothia sp. ZJ1223]|uniref:UDP-N-acetylmuramoyl-L-alanyl-D-glutamate--2, 6-diaminopimelate ligase n=1 Tax=Rothia sp. ZJ1223 TaxID=2811098 RepID=UPI00195685C0|nr:UDP-N-acetylmuramoyl-L-alanyl-D-glutamate--2,6-diaminopimelate ligase [Rothia sp. ZJ1223]